MFNFILPKLQLKIERWKWNKEYLVYVSNFGSFKDKYKNLIPLKISPNGYVTIKTEYGYQKAHRLVMKTWCPCPDMENLTVDHLNHNKRDNSVYNLEWVTREENELRAHRDALVLKDGELMTPDEIKLKKKLKPSQVYGEGAPLGKRTFDSLEEAAKCIIIVAKMNRCDGTPPKIENVMKKIENAARTGESYCRVRWTIGN